MSYLFQTEHYEAVLKAGDMERCLPALDLASRGPARRPELPELLRRAAGQQVRQGRARRARAATSCSPAIRGATTARSSTTTSTTTSTSTTASGTGWSRTRVLHELLRAGRVERGRATCGRSTSSATRCPTARRPRRPEEYVNHSLYLEAKTFLHGLFVVEDKLSMAHSLENRVPFLDNDLVDFAQRVPVGSSCATSSDVVQLNENEPGPKTERYFERTRDGKLLLRKVMERYVPESVTNQVKQGFSGPDASWFRGDSIDYVERELLRRRRGDLRVPRPRPRAVARRRAPRGPGEPPAAALVAAELRALVPHVPQGRPSVRVLLTGATGFVGSPPAPHPRRAPRGDRDRPPTARPPTSPGSSRTWRSRWTSRRCPPASTP